MASASHRWSLCGRSEEYRNLEQFYVERKHHDLVFITGPNGCGKTSLIASLQKRIARDAGYLLHGEFLPDSAPYEALIEMFQELEKQIRKKRDSATILKDIRQALSKREANTGLLLQVFPSLHFLLAAMRPRPQNNTKRSSFSIEETYLQRSVLHRNVLLLFQALSSCFPVVLALDNAMWADDDTLKLLESIRDGQSIKDFLCVIISREDIGSRLSQSETEFQEHHSSDSFTPSIPQFSQIHLNRLGRTGIADIIYSELGVSSRDKCADCVVDFVYRETGGNPFYVKEMMKSLVSEGYVSKNESETWMMQTSGSMDIPSLHDLMLTPFYHLPAHLKDVAQVAASFEGRTIHHSILSELVTTIPAAAVMNSITEIKTAMGVNDGTKGNFFYFPYGMQKLIYDKYNLAERKAMHQHVLRSLYGYLSPEALNANVFLVLHQASRSQWFRSTVKHKVELARLCLVAAKRSISCLAPSSAGIYVQKGFTYLMGIEDRWRINYDVTLELWTLSTQIEFANSNREAVHSLYLEIAQHSREPLDVVPACRAYVLSLGESGEVDRAIEAGLKWIRQLGESSEQSIDLRKTLTDLIKARKLLISSPNGRNPSLEDQVNPLQLLRNGASSLRSLESWGNNYDRCLTLFNCLLETEYVLGNYDEAKDAINVVLQHARDPQDKCSALRTKFQMVVQASNRNHSLGAKESIEVLSSFGIRFSLKPSKKDVMVEKMKLRAALGRRDLSVLASMGLMERDCLMKMLDQLSHFATSSANENLTAVVALRAMRISLKAGISKYLPQIVVAYAVPLRGNGKLEDAYMLSSFVEKLCERFPQQSPKFQLLLHSGALHLKNPFHSSVYHFIDLYGVALANADVEYGMTIGMHVPLLHYASGLPLTKDFESLLYMFEEKAIQLEQPTFVALFKGFRQFLHNLQGKCSNVLELNGKVMNEDEVLSHFEGNNAETMILMLERLKSYPLFDAPIVRLHTRITYVGIAALTLGRTSKCREYKKLGQKIVKEFKKLNNIGSRNARPVYMCLRAIQKHTVGSYQKAIDACRDSKMLHLAAMMNERCGEMLLDERGLNLGMEYLAAALWLYSDWGAEGKVHQMKVKFDISDRYTIPTSTDASSNEEMLDQNKISTISISNR